MRRVLFVDDEPQVLEGLRGLLRRQRKIWDMVFVTSADAALEELGRGPVDVVVSDMRMPGLDGAALLARVKAASPATVRIILSGHAERESIVQALPVAHQFLSKPCDAEVLRAVVERACALQQLICSDDVRRVVGRVERLPSVPKTYFELTQAAARPEATLADIAGIVERDPAMAVKVLQLVNSSYFGLAQAQASVGQAVKLLGVELLRALALTAHVFGVGVEGGAALDELQRRAILVGRLVRRFVPDSPDIHTAALVHDVGKVLLAMAEGGGPRASTEGDRGGVDPLAAERERFGATHAEVGAYLLGLWGLPIGVVEATACHHDPGLAGEPPGTGLLALHAGDAWVDAWADTGRVEDSRLEPRARELMERADLLLRWRRLAEHELEKVG